MDALLDLKIVADTLDKQRFTGTDQNPKGIRDLIGFVVSDIQRERQEHDRRVTELLEANNREVERRRETMQTIRLIYEALQETSHGRRRSQEGLACHVNLTTAEKCGRCSRERMVWESMERAEDLLRH